MTEIDHETLAHQALHRGIQDYLVKGQVDRHLIIRTIRSAIKLKRAEDTLCASEAARQHLNQALQTSNDTLERRMAEHTTELLKRTGHLQYLAGQFVLTEERERRRIAEFLHDQLQQLLVAALFNLDFLCSQRQAQPIHKQLREVGDIIKEIIKVSRTLTTELNPAILHEPDLGAALQWLGGWYEEKYGLVVTVEVEQPADIEAEEIRVALFRSVRELLFNVVKHAQVKTARIGLYRTEGGATRIVVSDQGIGFDPAQVQSKEGTAGAYGLFGLRERIELLGGRLEVDAAPGQGSRFTLHIPQRAPNNTTTPDPQIPKSRPPKDVSRRKQRRIR